MMITISNSSFQLSKGRLKGKKMLDMLSARERKTKGLRELKNLDCSVSPVKSQRRQGRNGSKYAITFPPEVH
jgi:hypothetical protein